MVRLINPSRKGKAGEAVGQDFAMWQGDVEVFLKGLPKTPVFDLIVTSPPYNIGKEYESQLRLDEYLTWQTRVIDELVPRLKDGGSLCWQVGNYVEENQIWPLDIEFAQIFKNCGSLREYLAPR